MLKAFQRFVRFVPEQRRPGDHEVPSARRIYYEANRYEAGVGDLQGHRLSTTRTASSRSTRPTCTSTR